MADDDDNESPNYTMQDDEENGMFRWMSAVVVLLAVAGFFGLAWYAYKSGGEAMNDKDVELIKADKSPVKEAPSNPGGMDIPNQDKTVYGLVGGKTEKPTVERILPAPETPVARGSETDTWMSDKVKDKSVGTDSNHEAEVKAASSPNGSATSETAPKAEQFNPAKIRNGEETVNASDTAPEKTVPPVVKAPAPVDTAPKEVAKASVPVQPVVAAVEKPKADAANPLPTLPAVEVKKETVASVPDEKPAASNAVTKGVRVQLGAYKSQAEAETNWKHIAKKFPDETSDKQHYIVRADLGDKGVFYRLQAGAFDSAHDGDAFCVTFVSQNQPCFLAKAK